jgi:hypothetical protein
MTGTALQAIRRDCHHPLEALYRNRDKVKKYSGFSITNFLYTPSHRRSG